MRVSCTTLESFRLFLEPEQEWMSEADLLATIRGEFIPTPEILLGRAFGQILEQPERYKVDGGYVNKPYIFDDDTLAPVWPLIDRRGVCEAKAVQTYDGIDVVAKADHLLGLVVSEFKTTVQSFEIEKYLASCQWRFLIDLFDARQVTYHVFRLNDHGNCVIELKGIESFSVYPYADLHEDCAELVASFGDYVRRKGLDGLLRQRQKDAAA